MPTIVDRNIAWNRKFVFYPSVLATSLQLSSTAAATRSFSQLDGLAGDIPTEIGTTDLFALLASTSGALDTGSSFIYGPTMMPYDLDYTKAIGVGVVWAHDNTAGLTSITWTTTYSAVQFGANIYNSAGGSTSDAATGGLLLEPTKALDTTIAAQTTGTFTVANNGEICVSPRGQIKSNTFKQGNAMWSFRSLVSAWIGGSTKVFYLGLLLDYSPHKTRGPAFTATLDRGPLQNYLDQAWNPVTTPPGS